jgi:hypothetical protein
MFITFFDILGIYYVGVLATLSQILKNKDDPMLIHCRRIFPSLFAGPLR